MAGCSSAGLIVQYYDIRAVSFGGSLPNARVLVLAGEYMRLLWSDVYLWIHLAGLAAVPIWLEITLIGMALGESVLPPLVEWGAIALIGILPIIWMQWQRPFYIYSLLLVALKPASLTDSQRRTLHLFRTPQVKLFTVIAAMGMGLLVWKLYAIAPVALNVARWLPQQHGLGFLIAAIAFALANLFLQVPVSVLRVLLAGDETIAQLQPYPLDQVAADFTLLGIPVSAIAPLPQPPLVQQKQNNDAPKAAVLSEEAAKLSPSYEKTALDSVGDVASTETESEL